MSLRDRAGLAFLAILRIVRSMYSDNGCVMTVRHALLALLSEGPKIGLRLREEFEERTGDVWPLNVGQVYTTLQRLERDGLIESNAEGQGRAAEGLPDHRCRAQRSGGVAAHAARRDPAPRRVGHQGARRHWRTRRRPSCDPADPPQATRGADADLYEDEGGRARRRADSPCRRRRTVPPRRAHAVARLRGRAPAQHGREPAERSSRRRQSVVTRRTVKVVG